MIGSEFHPRVMKPVWCVRGWEFFKLNVISWFGRHPVSPDMISFSLEMGYRNSNFISPDNLENVFHLNRTQIGLEILNTYSKMGVLLFLKKIIDDEQ